MGGSSGSVSIGIAAIAKLQRHPQLSWKDCCGPCASCGWPRARFPSRGFLFKQIVFIYGVVAASSKCSDYGGAKKTWCICFICWACWLLFGFTFLSLNFRLTHASSFLQILTIRHSDWQFLQARKHSTTCRIPWLKRYLWWSLRTIAGLGWCFGIRGVPPGRKFSCNTAVMSLGGWARPDMSVYTVYTVITCPSLQPHKSDKDFFQNVSWARW